MPLTSHPLNKFNSLVTSLFFFPISGFSRTIQFAAAQQQQMMVFVQIQQCGGSNKAAVDDTVPVYMQTPGGVSRVEVCVQGGRCQKRQSE